MNRLKNLINNIKDKSNFGYESFRNIERMSIWIIIILMVFMVFHKSFNYQTIGTVNITGIIDQFVKLESKNNLPAAEIKAQVKKFSFSLDQVLKIVSNKKNVILVPSEAVFAGAKDYTAEVLEQVMRSNNDANANKAK